MRGSGIANAVTCPWAGEIRARRTDSLVANRPSTSAQNVSLSGAVPVGIIGDDAKCVTTPQ
jgi:hypothetical protein